MAESANAEGSSLGNEIDGGSEPCEATTEDDVDLELIRQQVKEMEEEAKKLRVIQDEADRQLSLAVAALGRPLNLSVEQRLELDGRSIYVGNVDYGATAEELEAHFHGCGSVNRVTILCDKFTGQPRGFAYVEFDNKESVKTAFGLDESLFRGRQIKVTEKRTNEPGFTHARPFRGRGDRGGFFRGRGRFGDSRGRFRGAPRGRGGFQSRRRNTFTPY